MDKKQQRWHEQERERQQREQDTRMLPAGWASAVSRTTGDVYYINIATGHTTYEYPEAPALPGAGDGDDWERRPDERHRHQADNDDDEVERRRRRLQELLRDGAEQGQRARQFSAGGNVYGEDGELSPRGGLPRGDSVLSI